MSIIIAIGAIVTGESSAEHQYLVWFPATLCLCVCRCVCVLKVAGYQRTGVTMQAWR